ncbi:hypothetical protein XCV4430 [Xanthomonas euvesicatoria pv. vesicatoria str. 85-10]|uniref:Uncharacterized protein n=1 Tax=Xanthomonas euvesicatoria pv. vesicatoria (strain 85-10) TaxID=316273 RepID=Q3BM52_XANE5|nr:hypothetical protein XCV4430 [Xanthomonas euvesicatoria pv. vesicatoria str. 85-10]
MCQALDGTERAGSGNTGQRGNSAVLCKLIFLNATMGGGIEAIPVRAAPMPATVETWLAIRCPVVLVDALRTGCCGRPCNCASIRASACRGSVAPSSISARPLSRSISSLLAIGDKDGNTAGRMRHLTMDGRCQFSHRNIAAPHRAPKRTRFRRSRKNGIRSI